MSVEFLLVVLGVVLFGGMFLGLFLSYREIEGGRSRQSAAIEGWIETSNFYHWRRRDGSRDLMVRELEHHLREEERIAEQFVSNPNRETLRARRRVAAGQ